MDKAEVIADYDAKSTDELTVRIGETVEIIDKEMDSSGWWKVNNMIVYININVATCTWPYNADHTVLGKRP